MPKVFITMVDYFDPEKWPILGFNNLTRLEKLTKQYDDGDLIFHIGRRGKNPYTESRGRILGAATFNSQDVLSEDYLSSEQLEEFKKDSGEFKWPYALVMKHAWSFPKMPYITDIIKQKIPYQHTGVEAVRWGHGKWGDEKDVDALLSLWSNGEKASVNTPKNIPNLNSKYTTMKNKPNIFLKKDWEFFPRSWPVIAFTSEGWAKKLANVYKDGDLVLVCGSGSSKNKYKDARLKLLGIAEIEKNMVDTFYHCSEEAKGDESCYKWENGEKVFKWPYGFLIKRAHFFTPRREKKWTELLSSENMELYNKPGTSITGFVKLKEEDAKIILDLATNEAVVAFPESEDEIKNTESRKLSEAVKEPLEGWRSRSPKITARNAEMTYNAEGIGYTYVFRFGNKNIWKVGCSQYLKRRLSEISRHVPDEILQENWVSYLSCEHSSPQDAFNMEQKVLDILEAKLGTRHFRGERVHCTEEELRKAWQEAMNKIDSTL